VVTASPAGPSDVPVAAELPQRPPAFPRVLEPTRPLDTIPGTQVYRAPQQGAAPATAMGAGGLSPPAESSLPVGEATGSATAAPQ
jgi:penicillin-binding protein 1A